MVVLSGQAGTNYTARQGNEYCLLRAGLGNFQHTARYPTNPPERSNHCPFLWQHIHSYTHTHTHTHTQSRRHTHTLTHTHTHTHFLFALARRGTALRSVLWKTERQTRPLLHLDQLSVTDGAKKRCEATAEGVHYRRERTIIEIPV